MTSISSTSILSRPQITNAATVNQDIIPYNIRCFDSYYPPIKHKKNKNQINENLADAATRKATPTESKNRILIVDDEPDIARLFKLGLERQGGFEVDVYNDPTIALSNYRPGIYDLLLLDIKMPEMNGLELYQSIRKKAKEEDEEGEIRVCFITAFEESYNEFERLFPKLQIDCFIRKPITIDKLVKKVKTKLDS